MSPPPSPPPPLPVLSPPPSLPPPRSPDVTSTLTQEFLGAQGSTDCPPHTVRVESENDCWKSAWRAAKFSRETMSPDGVDVVEVAHWKSTYAYCLLNIRDHKALFVPGGQDTALARAANRTEATSSSCWDASPPLTCFFRPVCMGTIEDATKYREYFFKQHSLIGHQKCEVEQMGSPGFSGVPKCLHYVSVTLYCCPQARSGNIAHNMHAHDEICDLTHHQNNGVCSGEANTRYVLNNCCSYEWACGMNDPKTGAWKHGWCGHTNHHGLWDPYSEHNHPMSEEEEQEAREALTRAHAQQRAEWEQHGTPSPRALQALL